MTTIVTIDMGGTGATHAAGAREALSVPSMTDMGQSYAQANSARDQANTARGNANDAYSQANTAYSQANSARDQANAAYADANTRVLKSGDTMTGQLNISSGGLLVSGNVNVRSSGATNGLVFIDTVNNRLGIGLNVAPYQFLSTLHVYGDANITNGIVTSNINVTTVNTTTINASTVLTNSGINVSAQAADAYVQANTARGTANDAYGAANTKLASAGGTLSGDLIITGNLTVSGNQTILNTEVLTTEDADIILLSNTSSTPALNAGLIINRGTSTNTFLRWDEATDKWGWSDSGTTTYYFEDLRQGLSTTNTTFGTINTSLGTINTSYQAAYSQANTAGTNSLNAYGQANAAYSQANSAYGAANNRVLKAGDTMTGQLNISSGGLLVTGNVGIGTASPIFPLQVKTNTGTPPQALQLNTTDWTTTIGSAFQFGFGAATGNTYSEIRALSGGYNAWNNLVLQSGGGNVGIGTTSPIETLHVNGSIFTPSSIFFSTGSNTRISGSGSGELGINYNTVGTSAFMIRIYDVGAPANNNAIFQVARTTGNTKIGFDGTNPNSVSANLHVQTNSDRALHVEGPASGAVFLTAVNPNIGPNNIRELGLRGQNVNIYTGDGAKSNANVVLAATTAGNIGIGTTSPAAKLDIVGTNSTIALSFGSTVPNNPLFINTYGGWSGIGMDQSTAGLRLAGDYSTSGNPIVDIGYYTSGTVSHANWVSRLRVNQGGNVGIGVTTPQRKLDVFGSGILASFGSTMSVGAIAGIHFGYSESSSNVDTYKKSAMVFERTDNHNQGGNASGKIHFLLHNSSSTSASGTNSAVLTLDTDSNATLGSARVGIGTTSPTATLHVSGTSGDAAPTFRINGTAAASAFNWAGSIMNSSLGSSRNTILLIGQAESNRNCGYIGFNHSGTSGSNTNFLTFGLHSVDNVLNITGAGNVGIGTTTPATKLHVAGTGTFTGQLNTADIISLGYNVNGTVATSAARGIEFHNEGGRDYWIGKRAGAWTQPLDIAFYTGVRYHAHQSYNGHRFFVGGYDSVEAFSVGNGDNHVRVLYNLSVTGTITESSSIALKENISPITNALHSIAKLVGVTYDRKDGSAKNRAGLIKEEVEKVIPNIVNDDGIQYTNLIAYLVESIKELKAEIDVLKRQ